ncbi:MAG: hypothetical protein Q8J68_01835 [Methanolobus sp.]|uniref:hypothetical protein n=1 Tax=Methanolobus sp. TaxID=1874737 RepID=UPI0027304518|nr:hypothetical protein [Methanolobus sp.]MDP2216017.1 hypothetical protein [Methanolobus sp.]
MSERGLHFGEEANSIDEQSLGIKRASEFRNKEKIMKRILNMPQKKAESRGIGRSTFQDIQRRVREEGDINLKTIKVNPRRITMSVYLDRMPSHILSNILLRIGKIKSPSDNTRRSLSFYSSIIVIKSNITSCFKCSS